MRAEMTAFAASIFINVTAFTALDHAVYLHTNSMHGQKPAHAAPRIVGDSATQFDFVEVSPVVTMREPLKNNKIAAHDSVAQDPARTPDASRESAPKMEKAGPADQLGQHREESRSSAGSPASTPSAPRPPSPKNAASPSPEASDPSAMTLQAPSIPKPPVPASPASSPSPSLQGRTVRDDIDAAAVSRTRSHGAQVYGMTSFDAIGSGMGKYMKTLKERIWLAWFPYISFHYPKDFRAADAVIQFRLDREGRVRSVQIAEAQGAPVFAAFCMEAVQRASPFGPLPTEVLDLIGKDELDVQFVFHFW